MVHFIKILSTLWFNYLYALNLLPKAYKMASLGPYVNLDGLNLAALAISCKSKVTDVEFNIDGENVTGYRLGISYTCTFLQYKPPFIAKW